MTLKKTDSTKTDFTGEDELIDILSDNIQIDELPGCCAVLVVHNFADDSGIKYEIDEYNDENYPSTKNKISLLQVKRRMSYRLEKELFSEGKKPIVITLLKKEQSIMLSAFRAVHKAGKYRMTFKDFKSADGKRDLTLITYIK